ncbi:flavodoxin family protein [Nocardia crassostreae]|uniref:flavodoxin family protein n=1 Tax=Nocardia crassostreae TaxID=53428 RepID=UPI00082BCD5C|nr:flavodoxin family protein [Nocardia crassostreae]
MTALIVCTSVSHGNTQRVAEVIGEVLEARIVDPGQLDPAELPAYDMVGFGSGIFNMNFHPRLRQFIRKLPASQRQEAFVFCTSGFPEPRLRPYMHSMANTLEQKGFEVIGGFSCRAFDTWLPLRLVGGINKNRPNADDLAEARAFAEALRVRLSGNI